MTSPSLSPRDSLAAFCRSAFNVPSAPYGFLRLAQDVTDHVHQHFPTEQWFMGLSVMGGYFQGMSIENWSNALQKLKNCKDTQSILQLTFDALDKKVQDLFLHIVLLFNESEFQEAVDLLQHLDVNEGSVVLQEKHLMSVINGRIHVHESLVTLGRRINNQHIIRDRRFWDDKNHIIQLLTTYSSCKVVGIKYVDTDMPRDVKVNERAFRGLSDLRYLILEHNKDRLVFPAGSLDFVSPYIKLLDIHHFPLTCLASNHNFESLVILKMKHSRLEKLWDGNKSVPNLKKLILSFSENLKELPDLSTAYLSQLDLESCTSLTALPSNLNYEFLVQLNMKHTKLEKLWEGNIRVPRLATLMLSFSKNLKQLPNLSTAPLVGLDMDYCTSLMKMPSNINFQFLMELNMQHSSLEKLWEGRKMLPHLMKMDLSFSENLKEIPDLSNATALRSLNLESCSSLMEISSTIGKAFNLEILHLTGCSNLTTLPKSIGNCYGLQTLHLTNCSNLTTLPESLSKCFRLETLDLTNCSKLTTLPNSINRRVKYLRTDGCPGLKSLLRSI